METLLDMVSSYAGNTDVVVMALVFIPTATIAFFVMTASSRRMHRCRRRAKCAFSSRSCGARAHF